MADFGKSFGRGQRLQSVIERFSNDKLNDLQHQLHTDSSYDYTNESIERFCSKLADKYSEDNNSCAIERIQFEDDHPRLLFQSEVVDKSEIAEICDRSSTFGSNSSSQPQNGHKAQKTKISSDNSSRYDCDKSDEFTSKPTPTCSSFREYPTKKHQLVPSSGVMGRGQRLRMVANSIPAPGRTLQDEIQMACGTDYSNQSIESFVKKLTEKNGETS